MENMQKYKYNKVKKKIKCQDVISFFDGRLGENVTLCAFNSRLYREVDRKLNVKFNVVWKSSFGNFPHFLCYKINRSSKLKPLY